MIRDRQILDDMVESVREHTPLGEGNYITHFNNKISISKNSVFVKKVVYKYAVF